MNPLIPAEAITVPLYTVIFSVPSRTIAEGLHRNIYLQNLKTLGFTVNEQHSTRGLVTVLREYSVSKHIAELAELEALCENFNNLHIRFQGGQILIDIKDGTL